LDINIIEFKNPYLEIRQKILRKFRKPKGGRENFDTE